MEGHIEQGLERIPTTRMILFTIGGAIITILITLGFNYLFSFQLQSFSLFFVIPVGGIYVGLGAISGLYYYLFKYHKPFLFSHLTYKVYIVSLILGLVTIFSIYYMPYLFSRPHVTTDSNSISFIQYMKIETTSGNSFFVVNDSPSIQAVDIGQSANLTYFYLQLVGVLIGCLWPLSFKALVFLRKD